MRDTERLLIDWVSESSQEIGLSRDGATATRIVTQVNTDMRLRSCEPISVDICGAQQEETIDGIYS